VDALSRTDALGHCLVAKFSAMLESKARVRQERQPISLAANDPHSDQSRLDLLYHNWGATGKDFITEDAIMLAYPAARSLFVFFPPDRYAACVLESLFEMYHEDGLKRLPVAFLSNTLTVSDVKKYVTPQAETLMSSCYIPLHICTRQASTKFRVDLDEVILYIRKDTQNLDLPFGPCTSEGIKTAQDVRAANLDVAPVGTVLFPLWHMEHYWANISDSEELITETLSSAQKPPCRLIVKNCGRRYAIDNYQTHLTAWHEEFQNGEEYETLKFFLENSVPVLGLNGNIVVFGLGPMGDAKGPSSRDASRPASLSCTNHLGTHLVEACLLHRRQRVSNHDPIPLYLHQSLHYIVHEDFENNLLCQIYGSQKKPKTQDDYEALRNIDETSVIVAIPNARGMFNVCQLLPDLFGYHKNNDSTYSWARRAPAAVLCETVPISEEYTGNQNTSLDTTFTKVGRFFRQYVAFEMPWPRKPKGSMTLYVRSDLTPN
jgi:hypothetical protein